MLCISAAYVVMRCPSVHHVRRCSWTLSKQTYLQFFSPWGSDTIIVVFDTKLYSNISTGTPKLEQKSRFSSMSESCLWHQAWTSFLSVDGSRPHTTEQNLIVRIGKSKAEVTNNKRLRSRYCTVAANYRHEAPGGDTAAALSYTVLYDRYSVTTGRQCNGLGGVCARWVLLLVSYLLPVGKLDLFVCCVQLSWLAFLLLYGVIILTDFYPTIEVKEIVLVIWVFSLVVEEIRQVFITITVFTPIR